MNTLKLALSAVLMCASVASIHAVLPEKEMLNQITNVSHKLFDVQPLIKRFDPMLMPDWYNVVDEAQAYVKKHATLDKKLINAMNAIKQGNATICRAILRIHNAIASGVVRKDEMIKEGEDASVVFFNAPNGIKRAINALSSKYLIPGNKKAKDVIDMLANIIIKAAKRAFDEIIIDVHLR